MIKFYQNAWLKPYIDKNIDLRKEAKNEKDFSKLMNSAVFGKTMENVKKIEVLNLSQQKELKLSEPNYDTTKFFIGYLLAIEMKKKNRNTYE